MVARLNGVQGVPICLYPGVAQMVARLNGVQEAAGSNPVTRTKIRVVPLGTARIFFCLLCEPAARAYRSCRHAAPAALPGIVRQAVQPIRSASTPSAPRAPLCRARSVSSASSAAKKRSSIRGPHPREKLVIPFEGDPFEAIVLSIRRPRQGRVFRGASPVSSRSGMRSGGKEETTLSGERLVWIV